MHIKKIITSGCSFSDPNTPFTWPRQLEIFVKGIDPMVRFDHRGLCSQGQELIQKKASHAIYEALQTGYAPDQLAVFVMWSSIDRKSFYIDNPSSINSVVTNWKGSKQSWVLQFADLKNNPGNLAKISTTATEGSNQVAYNKNGGWLITSAHVQDELPFIRDYFMTSKDVDAPGPSHVSLENILMLQYLCKSKGIRLYQQFSTDNILDTYQKNKDHQIVRYLLDDLDRSTFISSESMYKFMGSRSELFEGVGNNHPNGLGHKLWVNEIVIPKLEADGFFD